jgi:hypothetical protein
MLIHVPQTVASLPASCIVLELHSSLEMAEEKVYTESAAVAEAGQREGYGGDAALLPIPSRINSPSGAHLLASQAARSAG